MARTVWGVGFLSQLQSHTSEINRHDFGVKWKDTIDTIDKDEQLLVRGVNKMTFVLPDPGPVNLEFERPADRARLEQTAKALAGRGFIAQVADSAEHARHLALDAIPKAPRSSAQPPRQ